MATEPLVNACRLIPAGSTHPRAAVVICPHCGERHWVCINEAAPRHECEATGLAFILLLHTAIGGAHGA
ncbi:hypothetical protein [Glutamicibacter nicotianae]|uniref:hypothetical protein n=1 Tax=Glutamicibacter nicotianae TaxID=37929 RepID=UPI002554B277|nr:hypothetical protein [Glutamicibacter nicotianae]WIV43048.1 hypothetical protein QQS42_12090 [Glutamicibacter nicotianae]